MTAHMVEYRNTFAWGKCYEIKKRRDNRWKALEVAHLIVEAIRIQPEWQHKMVFR
jgi:hypothetical protein